MKDFKKFLKAINRGEWDIFFDTIDEEALVEFINTWDDEMWDMAERKLDDDYINGIYDLLEYFEDDEEDSWIYDISDKEWGYMIASYDD